MDNWPVHLSMLSKLSKCSLNSLPSDKNLDWFKFKAFADDKIKVLKMMTLSLVG